MDLRRLLFLVWWCCLLAGSALAAAQGDFVQTKGGTLVLVKDTDGSGSGFLARLEGKPYLITNAHVLAATHSPTFTLLDGTRLVPVSIELGVGHDLVRLALQTAPAQSLEVAPDLAHTVRINDDVFVFGNSGGGGVVTSLPGKLRGLGPDRIEVDSPFIPGNSGSPIIHAASGQVIGIATYLTRTRDKFGGGEKSADGMVIRRFGYRLDSVKTWQPVKFTGFIAEAQQLEKVEELTKDLLGFMGAMQAKKTPNPATAALRAPVAAWQLKMSARGLSESDRRGAISSLLTSLRSLSHGDVMTLEKSLTYDYFRRELTEQRQVRDQLYDTFNERFETFTSPTQR